MLTILLNPIKNNRTKKEEAKASSFLGPHRLHADAFLCYIKQNYFLEGNMSNYRFSNTVRTDDTLRSSFNELTQATFCFNFEGWYASGHWSDLYVPHALIENERVISNISVNHMVFDLNGTRKYYLQLGTVMTAEDHRNQGLNHRIMEKILHDYREKADGIYLFGNDSVVDYYPKFGFRKAVETEYYLRKEQFGAPYELVKTDADALCDAIKQNRHNPNDGFYMNENLGLYRFWCAAEFDENIYRIPEVNAYVIATTENDAVHIHQIIGAQKADLNRLAASFGTQIREAVLRFTPADRQNLLNRPHKEEDCTLFILGDDLDRIEEDGLIFPSLSHA